MLKSAYGSDLARELTQLLDLPLKAGDELAGNLLARLVASSFGASGLCSRQRPLLCYLKSNPAISLGPC